MSKLFALVSCIFVSFHLISKTGCGIIGGMGYTASVKYMQCSNNTDRVTINICKFKLVRGKTGIFSLGLDILREEKTVLLRVRLERKNSANVYAPTIIDATFNLCDVTKNNITLQPMLTMSELFVKDGLVKLAPFLHPCPYYGKHEALNVTLDKIYVPNFIPSGDARIIGSVMDGKKKVLLQVSFAMYVKTPSLMQIN